MTSVAQTQVFVGIDYHDLVLQVCVLDEAGTILGNNDTPNDVGAVLAYVARVGRGRRLAGAAIEACCGAANLAQRLQEKGWKVTLAHAGICARMKQNPDKTDFGDAHLLADLVRIGYLPRVWLPPETIRDLRRLVRYRKQLVDHRRDIKLRIRALLREERIVAPQEAGAAWTKAWKERLQSVALAPHSRWVLDEHLAELEHMGVRIRQVETRMEEATRQDPVVAKLREQKGIGLVTAVVLRAEIGSFARFRNGKQLARYCAVTPKNVSSGKRQADGGLIQAGNLYLRGMVLEAAHRLARYVPRWRSLKEHLKSKGKPASVAAAAVANRWVRQLYWQMQAI